MSEPQKPFDEVHGWTLPSWEQANDIVQDEHGDALDKFVEQWEPNPETQGPLLTDEFRKDLAQVVRLVDGTLRAEMRRCLRGALEEFANYMNGADTLLVEYLIQDFLPHHGLADVDANPNWKEVIAAKAACDPATY